LSHARFVVEKVRAIAVSRDCSTANAAFPSAEPLNSDAFFAVVPQRFKDLPEAKLVVLHRKMGGRSARALKFLRQQGYPKLKNVAGGINAWAERIDPNVPQY
jgi:rhodanese-related sulfurtransferase